LKDVIHNDKLVETIWEHKREIKRGERGKKVDREIF
jgi:hypothetical protein